MVRLIRKPMNLSLAVVAVSFFICFRTAAQQFQQVSIYNDRTGDYAYGTIYNPFYYQQLNRIRDENSSRGIFNFDFTDTKKMENELLQLKKEQARLDALQKRQEEKNKALVEEYCNSESERLFKKYEDVFSLKSYDEKALAFRKLINEAIASDPFKAIGTLSKINADLDKEILNRKLAERPEILKRADELKKQETLIGSIQARFDKRNHLPEGTPSGIKNLIGKAKAGDPNAQYLVGMMYYSGSSIPIDKGAGLYWLRKSAAQGDINAELQLASDHFYYAEDAEGVKISFELFKNKQAALSPLQFKNLLRRLGNCFFYGTGVEQDMALGMGFYEKAAEGGDKADELVFKTAKTLYRGPIKKVQVSGFDPTQPYEVISKPSN